ncbi:MAG: hypothetical protein ACOCXT_01715 [Candidatus Dojkabacteria bacterium]
MEAVASATGGDTDAFTRHTNWYNVESQIPRQEIVLPTYTDTSGIQPLTATSVLTSTQTQSTKPAEGGTLTVTMDDIPDGCSYNAFYDAGQNKVLRGSKSTIRVPYYESKPKDGYPGHVAIISRGTNHNDCPVVNLSIPDVHGNSRTSLTINFTEQIVEENFARGEMAVDRLRTGLDLMREIGVEVPSDFLRPLVIWDFDTQSGGHGERILKQAENLIGELELDTPRVEIIKADAAEDFNYTLTLLNAVRRANDLEGDVVISIGSETPVLTDSPYLKDAIRELESGGGMIYISAADWLYDENKKKFVPRPVNPTAEQLNKAFDTAVFVTGSEPFSLGSNRALVNGYHEVLFDGLSFDMQKRPYLFNGSSFSPIAAWVSYNAYSAGFGDQLSREEQIQTFQLVDGYLAAAVLSTYEYVCSDGSTRAVTQDPTEKYPTTQAFPSGANRVFLPLIQMGKEDTRPDYCGTMANIKTILKNTRYSGSLENKVEELRQLGILK